MDFTDIIAQAKVNTDTEDSAAEALRELRKRLDAAVAALPDMTLMSQLQADMKSHSDALATAIAATTPTP